MKRTLIPIVIIVFFTIPCAAQWVPLDPPGVVDNIAAMIVHDSMLFDASSYTGIGRYDSNVGFHWVIADTGIYSGQQQDVSSFCSIGSNLFCGININPVVYRSTNNGSSWKVVKVLPTSASVYAVAAIDSILFAANCRSTDSGQSWSQMSITGNAFAVSGDTIVAAPGIYTSTDKGSSWTEHVIPNASCVAILGNILFAGTPGEFLYPNAFIYRSTNFGTSWDTVFINEYSINALTVVGSDIFVGTGDSGVYLSSDSGRSWHQENEGLLNTNVTCLAVFDSFLIAGTSGYNPHPYGPYRRPLSQMIGQKSAVQQGPVPLVLSLELYPNPSANSTTISFSLPESGVVTIVVSDILGRSISVPISEFEDAGMHQVELDTHTFPPGIYWCRLTAGEHSQITKLIIER